jgi:endonuclease/exonuclease/phosphatase (EEP) superfamily protein YafD
MITSTDYDTSSTYEQQPGCLVQIILFSSWLYLLFMIVYLLLRLVLGSDFWWLALLNAFTIYTFTPLIVLIPLTLLAGRWRMLARLGLVALLAVIWFGPFFQPPDIDSTDAPTVTVATFNVEAARGEFSENLDTFSLWLADNDVDVLFLQETPAEYIDTGIIALEDRYPYQEMQSGAQYEGLRRMTLSRFPLESVESEAQWQRATVTVNDQQIALYNVHLAWPFQSEPHIDLNTGSDWFNLLLRYDEENRNEQIKAFLDVIETETLPYIVGGDFNTSQHSIIYSSLAVEMQDSFRVASSGLGASWPVDRLFDFIPPLLRLDYVWYDRDAFRAIDAGIGPEFGSDHLPVIATLQQRPTTTDNED